MPLPRTLGGERVRLRKSGSMALALMLIVLWPQAALAVPPSGAWPAVPEMPLAIPADVASPPRVTADAAVLIDYTTGRILWSKDANAPRAPASTTKMMTALVALELGHPDALVTVSRSAAATPGSSAGLRAGEQYSLLQLLQGLLLRSGNDAAVAIAQYIAGSVPAFAALMNARAKAMGLTETNFVNPHGLTEPFHFSSAYDLALIARAALAIPAFAAIVDSPTLEMEGRDSHLGIIRRELHNTNRLLFSYEWVDGVKTGTTDAAGNCLVASGTRGGMKLIAVVLHSDDRWGDSLRLLQWGFSHFTYLHPVSAGQVVTTVAVPNAGGARLPLLAAVGVGVPIALDELPRLREALRLHVVFAPVREGEVLGEYRVALGPQTLLTVPLVASATVSPLPWWSQAWRWVRERI